MYYPSLFNENFANDLFDEVLNFPFDYGKRVRNEVLPKRRCTTDIKEYDDKYELDMELPGFAKEEIKAELKNGYLVVSAEHSETKAVKDTADKTVETEKAEAAEGEANAEATVETAKAEPKYLCRERYYGKTERSFYVGKDITKEDIKAQFTNGILTLTIPKAVKKPESESEFISISGD